MRNRIKKRPSMLLLEQVWMAAWMLLEQVVANMVTFTRENLKKARLVQVENLKLLMWQEKSHGKN